MENARADPYYRRFTTNHCTYFLQGACKRGVLCPYKHILPQEFNNAKYENVDEEDNEEDDEEVNPPEKEKDQAILSENQQNLNLQGNTSENIINNEEEIELKQGEKTYGNIIKLEEINDLTMDKKILENETEKEIAKEEDLDELSKPREDLFPFEVPKVRSTIKKVEDPIQKRIMKHIHDHTMPEPPKDTTITTLFVGGITEEVTANQLHGAFSTYGQVKGIKMMSKFACAFVTCQSRNSAEAAVEGLHERLYVKNVRLKVLWARKLSKNEKKSGESYNHLYNYEFAPYANDFRQNKVINEADPESAINDSKIKTFFKPPPPIGPPPELINDIEENLFEQHNYSSMNPKAFGGLK